MGEIFRRSLIWLARAHVIAAVAAANLAFADTLAVLDWSTSEGAEPQSVSVTLGWEFTTNQSIIVTQLGIWDDSQDGLIQAHQVGIWDSAQSLLVQSTVPAGASAALVDEYRFVPVTATPLASGETYVIGALFAGPELRSTGNGPVTTSPEITWRFGRTRDSASLTFPSDARPAAGALFFGPNFQFIIPEPCGLTLAAIGISAFARLRLKRQTPVVLQT